MKKWQFNLSSLSSTSINLPENVLAISKRCVLPTAKELAIHYSLPYLLLIQIKKFVNHNRKVPISRNAHYRSQSALTTRRR
ncbi:hypothetical protein QVD17_23096 [Tagetes erecta]|uniref:Uncharacterized protein n=1 Tax=Tagetes erecta TaxID=13708 RepID=A0AAD8KGR6_TARER|nr:hypothetical protein QVD17_23096 [Tagetes erecta]